MTIFNLSGRTALVTGASSGFGAHFAKLLAGSGARVLLAARRLDAIETLRDEIVDNGGLARAFRLDVADVESIKECAEEIADVDILVNNAGIVRSSTALDQSPADWDIVVDTNLKGMFLVA